MPLLEIDTISVSFGGLLVLDRVFTRRRDRLGDRADRPQRCGEDDAVQRRHGLAGALIGRGRARRPQRHVTKRHARARPESRAPSSASSPSARSPYARTCSSRSRCVGGGPPTSTTPGPSPTSCSNGSGSRHRRPQGRLPAHRDRSARGARGPRSAPHRGCCCSTNRRPVSTRTRPTRSGLLLELAGRRPRVLLVEHDMSLVMETCAFINVLDFGRIIADGTPERDPGRPRRAARLPRHRRRDRRRDTTRPARAETSTQRRAVPCSS